MKPIANCIKNYIHLCVLNYFSVLNLTQNVASKTNKSFIKLPLDEDLLEEIKEDIAEFIVSFYETKESFEEYMTEKLEERKETVTQIAEYIKSGWRQLTNYGYQLQVKGKLKSIELSGRSQYSYICENSDSSCEVCMDLDGQIFDIDEAETGKNLPPMHPNCRCSITAYPALTELVSEVDEQMLALMKERDSLPEGDPRIEELNAELKAIYESADESERHVYWRKSYSFYNFGGDVTDRLNEYMKNTSSNYADMHDRYWAENLADFYELVRNSGEMDLKNQPEWQNSAFIFDGEIVSQDALGNINYGYFGKHCSFPDSVLIAAGCVAQFLAGTSEFENLYVFLDDPRDTYRVMQGIEIYEEEN